LKHLKAREKESKVLELANKGFTIKEISKDVGICYASIRYHLKKNNIEPLKLSLQSKVNKLKPLVERGYNKTKIAHELKLSRKTVTDLLRKASLNTKGSHQGLNEKEREKRNETIRTLYKNGTSQLEIQKQFNLTNVSNIVNKKNCKH